MVIGIVNFYSARQNLLCAQFICNSEVSSIMKRTIFFNKYMMIGLTLSCSAVYAHDKKQLLQEMLEVVRYHELSEEDRRIFNQNHEIIIKQAHAQHLAKDAIKLIHQLSLTKNYAGQFICVGSSQMQNLLAIEVQKREKIVWQRDAALALQSCARQDQKKDVEMHKMLSVVQWEFLVAQYARWLHDASVLQKKVEDMNKKKP